MPGLKDQKGIKMNKILIIMFFATMLILLSACSEKFEDEVFENIPPDDGESKDCYVTNSNFNVGVGMECYYYGGQDVTYCDKARERGEICSENAAANKSNMRRAMEK